MGHTNSTTNLSLPQFVGTDKPTWLGDVNGAMQAIDAYAGSNDAAIAAVDAKADNAVADAASAVTTATNANNTAGTASTTATSASNLATQALTVANNADGHTNQLETKVGLLADLHTTDKTSIVNAINEVKDAEGDLTQLTTTDKSSLVAAINEAAQGGGGGSTPVLAYTAQGDGTKTYAQLLGEIETYLTNHSLKADSYIKDISASNTLIARVTDMYNHLFSAIIPMTGTKQQIYGYDTKNQTYTDAQISASVTVHDFSSTAAAATAKLELYI